MPDVSLSVTISRESVSLGMINVPGLIAVTVPDVSLSVVPGLSSYLFSCR